MTHKNSIQTISFISFAIGMAFFHIRCLPNNQPINLASESIRAEQVLCSPFDQKDFKGVLTVDVSRSSHVYYEPDSSFLLFDNIPDSFRYNTNFYLQVFAIQYSDHKASVDSDPLSLQLFDRRTNRVHGSQNHISHHVINELTNSSLRRFFSDYGFIVNDTGGRQAILVGIFNGEDIMESSIQVLVPPFAANPYDYQDEEENQQLTQLHPYHSFIDTADETKTNLFLSKAEKACNVW